MIRDGCIQRRRNGGGSDACLPTIAVDEGDSAPSAEAAREIGWDGGLVDAFPVLDQGTVVVSPVAISHSTNAVISPAIEYDNDATIYPSIPIHPHVRLHVSKANAVALRGLTFSSDDAVLQAKFAQGCDNATQFLRRHNLLNRSHHVVS